jgi:hypothetical protein
MDQGQKVNDTTLYGWPVRSARNCAWGESKDQYNYRLQKPNTGTWGCSVLDKVRNDIRLLSSGTWCVAEAEFTDDSQHSTAYIKRAQEKFPLKLRDSNTRLHGVISSKRAIIRPTVMVVKKFKFHTGMTMDGKRRESVLLSIYPGVLCEDRNSR